MISNSAADYSISLKFGTEFDYVTVDVYYVIQDQTSKFKVKTSSDRQIIALFYEIEVAESNGDVRVLIGSCETAVCTHAQYK